MRPRVNHRQGKTNLGLVALLWLIVGIGLFSDTLNVTWDGTNWNTTWTNGGGCTCDTSCAIEYQTTGGNPDHRRRARCEGKNDTPTGHHEWAGTWEDLGVTGGNTVSTIQMTDLDYQYTTDTTCDDVDIGPFELRNSSDSLVAAMWAGSGTLTTAGAYASAGSQTAQSVGALTASNSSIELWMQIILDTGSSSTAVCESSIDNLDIAIVHTAPPSNIINRFLITWNLARPATYETRVRFMSGRPGPAITRRIF